MVYGCVSLSKDTLWLGEGRYEEVVTGEEWNRDIRGVKFVDLFKWLQSNKTLRSTLFSLLDDVYFRSEVHRE